MTQDRTRQDKSAPGSPEDAARRWASEMAAIFAAAAETDSAGQQAGPWCFELHRFDKVSVASATLGRRRLVRNYGLVSAAGLDHVLLVLCESAAVIGLDREERRAAAGDLVILDLSKTFAIDAAALDVIAMVIPRSMLRLPPLALDRLHGSLVAGGGTFGLLLGEHLRLMAKIAHRIGAEEGRSATTSVALLVSNTLSAVLSRQAKDGGEPLAIELAAIRSFIARHLPQSSLTTARICKEFGLSRSALYRVAEPLGGISQYIRNERLERARLHLASVGQGRGSVARLATKAGFANEASFARAFKQRFGTTPREAILMAAKESGADGLRHRDARSLRTWLDLTTLSGSAPPASPPLTTDDRRRPRT